MTSRIRIHPSGPEFSRLVWGAWRALAGVQTRTPAGMLRMIGTCLDLGITTIDHADVYGGYGVEELFGTALALDPSLRSRIEIVTKCGIATPCPARPQYRVEHYDTSAAHIRRSLERSLRNLRTDHVDLLLIHRPDPFMDADDTAAGLTAVLEAGMTRAIGVSNFAPSQIALLQSRLAVPLVTDQIELSLLHTAPLFDGTLDLLQEKRMRPMAWSPLGGGRITGDAAEGGALAEILGELAARHGLGDIAVAAVAWLLQHPSRPLPILGTTNADRLRALAEADRMVLERQEWFAVLEAAVGQPVP